MPLGPHDDRQFSLSTGISSGELAPLVFLTVIEHVYGLGALLYAALAGRPPFDGPSATAILEMVRNRPPTPLVGVPRPLARALAGLPADVARLAARVPGPIGTAVGMSDVIRGNMARRVLSR